jgi:hypothetical protein
VKILGGSFTGSTVVHGMVFNREPEGWCIRHSGALKLRCVQVW